MMRTKRNNFYRRWREAESAGRRTAWRRLARRAGPAAVTAAAALLLWGGLGVPHRLPAAGDGGPDRLVRNAGKRRRVCAERGRLHPRRRAAGGSGRSSNSSGPCWTATRTTTGTVLAALEDAQAGVHVQLHGYDAASGTLTFSAVLPQVVDIPAYVRRLEGQRPVCTGRLRRLRDGGGRLHAAAGLCAGRPGKRGEGGRAMRLETAVTERDKKLLYGAGLAAAVLLYGVFALSPALQAHAAAARERRQAADRRGQMQAAAGEAAARESERKRPPRPCGRRRGTHTPCFPARNWTPL